MSELVISSESKVTCQKESIYASFQHAARQLGGLVAVDYFFAKEISQCLEPSGVSVSSQVTEQQQWFHLLVALSASLRDGHSCLPLAQVAGKRLFTDPINQSETSTKGFLFSDLDTLTALMAALPLADSDKIAPSEQQPIVFSHNRLYLRRYYQFEQELKQVVRERRVVSTKLVESLSNSNETFEDVGNIRSIITTLFPGLASLSDKQSDTQNSEIDWQAVAVANAINKDFAIIAGGPGTGKTYTVTKLLAALIMLARANIESQKESQFTAPKISLVAPTGKAAQRLSESITSAVKAFRGTINDEVLDLIPEQAKTIHRLLGVIPEQVNFRHHQDNLLDIDILLIDEVSMVDLPMMARIFRALPINTKVILLGDADQLPSVAIGSVLADFAPRPHLGYSALNHQYLAQVTGYQSLTKDQTADANSAQYSAADCVTFLMKSRRFDGEGGIGRIANYVINGQYQESWQLLKQSEVLDSSLQDESLSNDKQLTLLPGNVETWLTPLVEQYYLGLSQCSKVEDAFALLAKFRILSSTRKGPQGVESLNALVIDILRNKGVIPFNRFESNTSLYASQPIMINENDYRLGVYNGDIGVLWRNSQGHLMAVFENAQGGYDWILPSRLPKFETVYAMTIHKTQGSEFEHVAMVLPEQKDNRLLSRELLYTGITRAKLKLSIASSQSVWQSGVSQQVKRHSGLAID
ncbi:exodeoxyribonuclease V subunit alpha [Cognaticolwellia beringensis]|uniref:RecBCD enzyme subunit RecD n=1 Tax=Cognaticolwellia beringensis TaxID=1967665 RepID=A0A222GAX7_9GAMM|nr:exodeoxyribonuclease V subunit alpha [Cognaticolwellia beringensis]ASP49039.1 exodeoxyribonuclease V subunit alpha [Cognaticolwellia beringensis]